MVKMNLQKKLKQTFIDWHREHPNDPYLHRLHSQLLKELGEVADKIREKRDKIQKAIDEENKFRRSTAFHSYAGASRRGFTEIEMDKFGSIVTQLNWGLGLLVEDSKVEGEK